MRRVNLWLAALVLLIAVPYYWFLIDSSAVGIAAKPLTIAQLRQLAASLPGELPTQIRYEMVGSRVVSGNLVTAGAGVMDMELEILAFQIITPDCPPIEINGRQRSSQHTSQSKGEPAPHAIAPGVVSIPIAGMPSGTQMFYVRTADGGEYLFTGDVAPIPDSWQSATPPARWVTSRDPRLKRSDIVAWLKTIRALKRRTPSLFVVEGSDRVLPATFAQGFAAP